MRERLNWKSNQALIPLSIGLIGHRNISEFEQNQLLLEFDSAIENLIGKDRETPFILFTSLAKGADQIGFRSKFRDQMTIVAILPFRVDEYERDFDSAQDLFEFQKCLAESDLVHQPFLDTNPPVDRNLRYQECANWISDRSNILIALWNGEFNNKPGGTSDTLRYRTKFRSVEESLHGVNRDFLHISTSNSLASKNIECTCTGHSNPSEMLVSDRKVLGAFNKELRLRTSSSASPKFESPLLIDEIASSLKRRHLKVSRSILLGGLITLNLVNLTQITQSDRFFLMTLIMGLVTFGFWYTSVKSKLKVRYENFRIFAETLRIQGLWDVVGLKKHILSDTQVSIETDSWVFRLYINLVLCSELTNNSGYLHKVEEEQKTRVASIEWITAQTNYLGGDGQTRGAISRSKRSIKVYENLTRVFLVAASATFVINQVLGIKRRSFNSDAIYATYSMVVPLALSISAGCAAYIQFLGAREIVNRLSSSMEIFKRGLQQITTNKEVDNLATIEKIVEEIGLESYRESTFWYRINQSREIKPV